MNNFTFYAPTMFAFGQGEASRVGALVRQFGGSKVLLVAGGGSVKKNGAYDAVAASLREAGLPWCELWGVQANPRSGKVYEGIDLARTEGVDFLLAIGGGMIRDVLLREMPFVLKKRVYAVAAILGALGYALLLRAGVGEIMAYGLGMMITTAVRILATVFKWNLPKAI